MATLAPSRNKCRQGNSMARVTPCGPQGGHALC